MNNFFKNIEQLISPYASQYTPEGSEVKAVVHQWAHAIAYDNDIFHNIKDVKNLIDERKLLTQIFKRTFE